jgi:hypothetical protein
LKIADGVFHSESLYLYAPPDIPSALGSKLVLGPSALGISEGDALTADNAVFQRLPNADDDGNGPPGLYWQIKAIHGLRFAVNEEAFGWRGNQYALFALKEDVTSARFVEGYSGESAKRKYAPLVGEGWRPPLLLQQKADGDVWAIDVGAPYDFLASWSVYSIGADGAAKRCAIQFHRDAKSAVALLPAPVRKLAALLNGTLGNGEDEGTFQQTAGIKIDVMHSWASVAVRPWAAVKATPYNNRDTVDAGLKTWSRKAPSFRRLYWKIIRQYPKAERSLMRYYHTQFYLSGARSKAMAKQALDIAFRMYFVFPG